MDYSKKMNSKCAHCGKLIYIYTDRFPEQMWYHEHIDYANSAFCSPWESPHGLHAVPVVEIMEDPC